MRSKIIKVFQLQYKKWISTMPELTSDFQSLPTEYQQVIQLAQETNKIAIAPLQLLVGGWSGAMV